MASGFDALRSLIESAKEDLIASRLLYENRLYPHAVFFLAMAVEKSFKTLVFAPEGVIDLDIAKKMGHRPWAHAMRMGCEALYNIYNRVRSDEKISLLVAELSRRLGSNPFQWIESNIRNIELCIKVLDSSVYGEFVKQLLLCSFSPDCVRGHIEGLKRFERDLEKIASIDDQQLMIGLSEAMNRILEALEETAIQRSLMTRESIEPLKRELFKAVRPIASAIKLIIKIFHPAVSLLVLSALLSPHINATRYPDKVGDIELSPSSYKKDMPLVKMLGELIEIAEKAICSLEEVLAIIYRKTRLGDMLENTTRNP